MLYRGKCFLSDLSIPKTIRLNKTLNLNNSINLNKSINSNKSQPINFEYRAKSEHGNDDSTNQEQGNLISNLNKSSDCGVSRLILDFEGVREAVTEEFEV